MFSEFIPRISFRPTRTFPHSDFVHRPHIYSWALNSFFFLEILKPSKGNYTTGCGGSYNQPGIVSSPNYPDVISSPKNCTYSITASVYETINLHFNSFDLGSEFCHGSWLVIFDGPTADPEKIISQNCGNIAPDDIRSTSNSMTIRYVSNFQTLFWYG